MIRIPFDVVTHYHLPPIGLSDADIEYIDNFHITHADEMEYRWYRYPSANKVTYHSKDTPIDLENSDVDFLSIDNFWNLLPDAIKTKFTDYFTEEFFGQASNPNYRGIRLYLNNPKTPGVHLHKDIYSGGGIPRQLGINIPISANSLTSDLNLYDDELNLINTARYQKGTPTALNTSVFHEVVHHDRGSIRKVLTMSPGEITMEDFLKAFSEGRVVKL